MYYLGDGLSRTRSFVLQWNNVLTVRQFYFSLLPKTLYDMSNVSQNFIFKDK